MSTVLGLKGTGHFATNEAPENWREMLLLLFPNGEAPLTALLAKLKSEPTDDPRFHWWEKGLPTQRTLANGAQLVGATTLTVDDASIFRKSHVVLNERTEEIMFVTADPANATQIVVVRGKGEIAAAAINDDDALLIIGTVNEEGALATTPLAYQPSEVFNYTQIFRTPLSVTRTAKKTRLRTDRTGPYREAKREALQLHAIEMEKAFIFGQRLQETGPDGQPRRTTRGVRTFISTNQLTDANTNGIWNDADFTRVFEEVFRYGSSEKLMLAGSTVLSVITNWAKDMSVINMVPTDQTYGMKIAHVLTPFGDLYVKNHPLMSDHPVYRKDALILDLDKLTYRYIDDTMFLKNIQTPGQDASKDEYLTECGLEVWHEKAHSLLTNMTSYAAAG